MTGEDRVEGGGIKTKNKEIAAEVVWCFTEQLTSMVPAGNKMSLAGVSGCGRPSQRETLAQRRALPWGSLWGEPALPKSRSTKRS